MMNLSLHLKKILVTIVLSLNLFGYAATPNNSFAVSVYSELSQPEQNLVFSPYSLHTNLSLLWCGAKGKTKKELIQALFLPRRNTEIFELFNRPVRLVTATALFTHNEIELLSSFESKASKHFGASLLPIDFHNSAAAAAEMNGWIQEKTQGKIPSLITEDDLNEQTKLVIANAVYFEKKWAHPFLASNTKTASFYPQDLPEIDVEMVRQTHSFPYFETENAQIVSLPFAKEKSANAECLLILPSEDSSLAELEEHLDAETLSTWMKNLKKTSVAVQLPKFSLSNRLSMDEALQSLGIETAYTEAAHFGGIDGTRELFLQTCLHEAFFSLDEKGVTAAAATTSHMGMTCMPPEKEPEASFIAERPFLFMIVSKETNDILFMGRYTNPSVNEN